MVEDHHSEQQVAEQAEQQAAEPATVEDSTKMMTTLMHV